MVSLNTEIDPKVDKTACGWKIIIQYSRKIEIIKKGKHNWQKKANTSLNCKKIIINTNYSTIYFKI